jgi:TadE-like protein
MRLVRGRFRRGRDSGAALLETMLVAPVFFALILGLMEFGLVYRDTLTTSDAVANGARTGAVIGPRLTESGVNADFEIIRQVRNSLGSIPVEWVDRIVVFKADGPGAGSAAAQVPNACKTGGSVTDVCNVYDPANAFLAVDTGDNAFFSNCPSGRACSWRPASRRNGPTAADIDYIGVWIRLDRPYITGMFGDQFTIEQSYVVRLEPGMLD